MLICLEHINQAQKTGHLSKIYLFLRLRNYGKAHGGFFRGFSFTRHERERILPWLRSQGYVVGDRIVNYRRICRNEKISNWKFARLSSDYLTTKNVFKRWLLSANEAYQLDWRWRIQNKKSKEIDWRSKTVVPKQVYGRAMDQKRFRVEKFKEGSGGYSGRVSNEILSKGIGCCKQTISNWRKRTKKGASLYVKKIYTAEDPSGFPGSINNFHFSIKKKRFIHIDLKIYTYFNKISIFNNRYTLKYSLFGNILDSRESTDAFSKGS